MISTLLTTRRIKVVKNKDLGRQPKKRNKMEMKMLRKNKREKILMKPNHLKPLRMKTKKLGKKTWEDRSLFADKHFEPLDSML